jgi:hypothetical protein
VLRVLERIAPDLATLAEERDKLTREVLGQKQSQAWAAWVERARGQAKVDVSGRPPTPRG